MSALRPDFINLLRASADTAVMQHPIQALSTKMQCQCPAGPRPELPVIMANWHHDYYFEAVVTPVHELTDAMKAAPVCNASLC